MSRIVFYAAFTLSSLVHLGTASTTFVQKLIRYAYSSVLPLVSYTIYTLQPQHMVSRSDPSICGVSLRLIIIDGVFFEGYFFLDRQRNVLLYATGTLPWLFNTMLGYKFSVSYVHFQPFQPLFKQAKECVTSKTIESVKTDNSSNAMPIHMTLSPVGMLRPLNLLVPN